jgi:hypothetical protein
MNWYQPIKAYNQFNKLIQHWGSQGLILVTAAEFSYLFSLFWIWFPLPKIGFSKEKEEDGIALVGCIIYDTIILEWGCLYQLKDYKEKKD